MDDEKPLTNQEVWDLLEKTRVMIEGGPTRPRPDSPLPPPEKPLESMTILEMSQLPEAPAYLKTPEMQKRLAAMAKDYGVPSHQKKAPPSS